LEESRGWYESFPIIFQDDLPLVAPAQLRLGAVYEAADRPEAARRAYRRALELWQDGDPRLAPALSHARARLAALDQR
jgi:tetratricopeptide (TPR) repeat protein